MIKVFSWFTKNNIDCWAAKEKYWVLPYLCFMCILISDTQDAKKEIQDSEVVEEN